MFEIEDGAEDLPQDQEPEDKTEATPPPQPVVPQIDINQVAGQIIGKVMDGLSRQAQRDVGVSMSATQQWVERQLRNGVPPKSVEVLLELRAAEKADELAASRQSQSDNFVSQFNASVWQDVDSAFDEFSEHIPRLEDSEKRITLDTHAKLMATPEVVARINENKKPTQKQIKTAMAAVIDEKLKQEGRTRPALPVDRGSQKSAAVTASNTDPVANLNSEQKTFYNAFKKEMGHAEALKVAKQFY